MKEVEINEKNQLAIPMYSIVNALSEDQRVTLFNWLAMDEYLIAGILHMLVDEWGYWDGEYNWSLSRETASKLRQELIPVMPDIARELIKELLRKNIELETKIRSLDKWAWDLWHHHQNAHPEGNIPESPKYERSYWPTDDDAWALLNKAGRHNSGTNQDPGSQPSETTGRRPGDHLPGRDDREG